MSPECADCDRLNDGDKVLGAVQDFPHQHLLALLGLPARGNVLPGNDEAADPALIVPPWSDLALQPV